jgi:hypothetical protein
MIGSDVPPFRVMPAGINGQKVAGWWPNEGPFNG